MIAGPRRACRSVPARRLVALFAIYHGHAHGTEATGAIAAYMAGFADRDGDPARLRHRGSARAIAALAPHAPPSAGAVIAAAGTYLLATS